MQISDDADDDDRVSFPKAGPTEKNGVVSRCLPHRHLRATQYTVATARIEPATLRLHDKNPTAIPL